MEGGRDEGRRTLLWPKKKVEKESNISISLNAKRRDDEKNTFTGGGK